MFMVYFQYTLQPLMFLQIHHMFKYAKILPNIFLLIFLICAGQHLYIPLYKIKYTIMTITSVSDFRKDIKLYLDRVSKNFETLIINRGKDSGIVVMSLNEYNSLMATSHELSSRKNEMRLDSALEKLKTGKSFSKDLIEK